MIVHKTNKDEDSKSLPVLGNAKIFWRGESSQPQNNQSTQVNNQSYVDPEDIDVPF